MWSGYAEHGLGDEALKGLRKCKSGFYEIGEQLHGKIKENGLLDTSIVAGSALVNMYTKCGTLEKAHSVERASET